MPVQLKAAQVVVKSAQMQKSYLASSAVDEVARLVEQSGTQCRLSGQNFPRTPTGITTCYATGNRFPPVNFQPHTLLCMSIGNNFHFLYFVAVSRVMKQ